MDNVNAAIKKVYLDLIKKGTKVVEYRDMSEYWTKKLVDVESYKGLTVQEVIDGLQQGKLKLKPRAIDTITFFCEGTRTQYRVLSINTYVGHKLFAIRLGKKIK